jgi:hypothetical protein
LQALIGSIEYRESTQETLIPENRVFIQTNSHGTFLWILMPVSTTLTSQESLRPSPKSRSLSDVFSADEGDVAAPQRILTAAFSAGPVSQFTGNTQWSSGEGACSQVAAASTSGFWDKL